MAGTVDETVAKNPGQLNAFLEDAPCVVNENITPHVANGTVGVMRKFFVQRGLASLQETIFPNVFFIPREVKYVDVEVPHSASLIPLKTRRFGTGSMKNAGSMQYELAYCFTFHKIQGVTVDEIVLDLGKRPHVLGHLDFFGVYVALSRVRSLEGIRILPFRAAGDDHLRRFKKPIFPLMKEAEWLSECSYSFDASVGKKARSKEDKKAK